MDRTRTVYVAVMSLAGLGLGVLGFVYPAFRDGPAPPMLLLLLVSLLVDAAAMRGLFGLRPLTMGLRFGGVLSGAILYLIAGVVGAQTKIAQAAG